MPLLINPIVAPRVYLQTAWPHTISWGVCMCVCARASNRWSIPKLQCVVSCLLFVGIAAWNIWPHYKYYVQLLVHHVNIGHNKNIYNKKNMRQESIKKSHVQLDLRKIKERSDFFCIHLIFRTVLTWSTALCEGLCSVFTCLDGLAIWIGFDPFKLQCL